MACAANLCMGEKPIRAARAMLLHYKVPIVSTSSVDRVTRTHPLALHLGGNRRTAPEDPGLRAA